MLGRMSALPVPEPLEKYSVKGLYQRISSYIKHRYQSRKNDEELEVLYYDTSGKPYLVHAIGYSDSRLIFLFCSKPGESDDNKYQILLHMNAVQIIIHNFKKIDEMKKPEMGYLGNISKSNDLPDK